jgi:quinol monooxygenase YgiN
MTGSSPSSDTPAPAVTVVIEYRALPGVVEQALSEMDALVATVVATEPDCRGIRLLRDTVDPARLLLVEEWTSREAYLGPHFHTTHLTAFKAKAASLFAGAPKIEFWRAKSGYRSA